MSETNIDLSTISTRQLAVELAKRPDLPTLVRPDGLLDPEIWPIRPALGAITCVDSIAVKRRHSCVYGAVIRRNTGKFSSRLAFIGGVVAKYESYDKAVERHWRDDLNLRVNLLTRWKYPLCAQQYAPQIDLVNQLGFCEDPGKHATAINYAVLIENEHELRFGTKIGGQEACALEWHSEETCPPEEEWGYNARTPFLELLNRVKSYTF